MSGQTDSRKTKVLEAALTVAQRHGWHQMSRQAVAAWAGVSEGTVSNAFGDMPALRDAVMREAVTREIYPIVAAGLAERHPIAESAERPVKAKALAFLAG